MLRASVAAAASAYEHQCVLDTGCTGHMTDDLSLFTNPELIVPTNVPVAGVDPDGGLVATGVGRGVLSVQGSLVPLDRLY